jgi:hypothetical protein
MDLKYDEQWFAVAFGGVGALAGWGSWQVILTHTSSCCRQCELIGEFQTNNQNKRVT